MGAFLIRSLPSSCFTLFYVVVLPHRPALADFSALPSGVMGQFGWRLLVQTGRFLDAHAWGSVALPAIIGSSQVFSCPWTVFVLAGAILEADTLWSQRVFPN